MRKTTVWVLFAALIVSCSSDPNERANQAFVEAQQTIEKAEKQGPEERLRLLEAAEQKLKGIVSSYPGSNLAVQLSSGQRVGTVSFKGVSTLLMDARWALCVAKALEQVPSIKDGSSRGEALWAIAEAQVKAGMAKEAATTLEEAARLARSEEDVGYSTSLLSKIAAVQTKAGMLAKATATFDEATRGDVPRSVEIG